jgi:hypothetical protein
MGAFRDLVSLGHVRRLAASFATEIARFFRRLASMYFWKGVRPVEVLAIMPHDAREVQMGG